MLFFQSYWYTDVSRYGGIRSRHRSRYGRTRVSTAARLGEGEEIYPSSPADSRAIPSEDGWTITQRYTVGRRGGDSTAGAKLEGYPSWGIVACGVSRYMDSGVPFSTSGRPRLRDRTAHDRVRL